MASFDSKLDRVGVISGASIYPFVWNILLAARDEGLGGTITTFVGGSDVELGIFCGASHYAFSAMIPMGKPVKQLTRLSRNPVNSFAVLETFDGPVLITKSEKWLSQTALTKVLGLLQFALVEVKM